LRTDYLNVGGSGRFVGWIDFTSDSKSALVVTGNNEVLIVPLAGGKSEQISHGGAISFARLSADGTVVVVGLANQGVALVTRPEHKVIAQIAEPQVAAAAIAPDNSAVAITTQDGRLLVYGADRSLRWQTDKVEPLGLRDVAFSPDGSRIAAVPTVSGAPRVWDAKTGKLLATFSGSAKLNSVAFSADGRHVVSSGFAPAIVWNADTGAPELTLRSTTAALSAHFVGDRDCLGWRDRHGAGRLWCGSELIVGEQRDAGRSLGRGGLRSGRTACLEHLGAARGWRDDGCLRGAGGGWRPR
jgi:WD40 repeat protein